MEPVIYSQFHNHLSSNVTFGSQQSTDLFSYFPPGISDHQRDTSEPQ